jgi:vacuolar-type H+-ATPase subunit I/STV1
LNFSFSESDGFSAEENVNEVEYTPAEEPQFSLSDVETFSLNFKKKDDEGNDDGEKDKDDKTKVNDSDKSTEDTKDSEDDDKKKKKTTYSLDEIVEYQELLTKFSELETKYNSLVGEKTQLESELQGLREFKLAADRKDKEEMINNFYMLDDEAKKDVRENIDKYSLDDIEAKLSILCVRNKVNFNLEGDNTQNGPITYNLGMTDFDESTPAWVKAVLDTAKTLN